jgi:general secretion pathway protein I
VKRRNSRQRGYSLIEVLVAFVILASTLAVLFRVFSAGLRNIDTASDYSQAVVIAESRLAAPGVAEPLVPGIQQGTVADRFAWSRRIRPFDDSQRQGMSRPTIAAYRIDVAVQWHSYGDDRSVELSTIRLDNREPSR